MMMKNAAIICVGLMLTLVTASGKEYDEGVFSLNGSDWMLSYWKQPADWTWFRLALLTIR